MISKDREIVFERIAHLISSGKLDKKTYDFYFKDTNIGFMNYEELLSFLKGDDIQ